MRRISDKGAAGVPSPCAKVRSFGIAAAPDVAEFALEQAPEYAAVLQFSSSAFVPAAAWMDGRSFGKVFTHSTLGSHFIELLTRLQHDAVMAASWWEVLGADLGMPDSLARCALQHALVAQPRGTVLFTSMKSEHVRENAAVLTAPVAAEQLQRFESLAREWFSQHDKDRPAET